MSASLPCGLFVGLSTLDVVQLVERLPGPDEKVQALDDMFAAGGPATNAAVGFAASGSSATMLLTRAGDGPQWELMRNDLEACGVDTLRAPTQPGRRPTVATILVTRATGHRAVISSQDKAHLLAAPAPDPADVLARLDVERFDVVQLDGHEADLAEAVAIRARAAGIPVILDGGSWKPSTPRLLPLVDAAVVSSAFHPPALNTRDNPEAVLEFLLACGVRFAAVTRGSNPICYRFAAGAGEVPVEQVAAVDTLGAGDFFHAGFSAHVARHGMSYASLVEALRTGSALAARSIASFGTRAWLGEHQTP